MIHSEVTLLDVLFPKVRAEILRALFRNSNDRRYVRELMRETGLALSTVQDAAEAQWYWNRNELLQWISSILCAERRSPSVS